MVVEQPMAKIAWLLTVGCTWFVAILALILLLVGCENKGKCLQGHNVTTWYPMVVGHSVIMMPMIVWQCDQWEYPEGKPNE